MDELSLYVTCPKGLEYILNDELKDLLGKDTKVHPSGVEISADQAALSRISLWSRIANRVLLTLGETRKADRTGVYELAFGIPWENYLNPEEPYWISAFGQRGNIKHSGFGAQVVKDAVNDYFRQLEQQPPYIDKSRAKQVVQLSISQRIALSLDLSGRSLHRRGYRLEGEKAPLKENLAAALLYRSGWPSKLMSQLGELSTIETLEGNLFDPMCGSGTLVIEAAMMAMDLAPGLLDPDFSFLYAPWFDKQVWVDELSRAQQRAVLGKRRWQGSLRGTDNNPEAIRAARRNLARAGLDRWVEFTKGDATTMEPPPGSKASLQSGRCLLICNPPYGERLGDELKLRSLYQNFGRQLKAQFGGWQASIFTANKFLAKELGMQIKKQYKFHNGSLPATLYLYEIFDRIAVNSNESFDAGRLEAEGVAKIPPSSTEQHRRVFSKQAQMFANRLKKNKKHLERWIKKEALQAYRIYDADLPEYAVAIDCYGDYACIQEYAPAKHIDPEKANQRVLDVLEVVESILELPQQHIFLKQRQKQKGSGQYQRFQHLQKEAVVEEYGCKLKINLSDYLDTGLFLDHRPMRKYIQDNASGKSFLNLFCYTASASVHAAVGGAVQTTNVDLSNTYLSWAKKNFELNNLLGKPGHELGSGNETDKHQFIKSDVLKWLTLGRSRFDIIFLDPPTFSNSKAMESSLDLQKDHVELICKAMIRLNVGGLLIFSSNYRRFKLSGRLYDEFDITEKTAFSLPKDFARKRAHQSWFICHRQTN